MAGAFSSAYSSAFGGEALPPPDIILDFPFFDSVVFEGDFNVLVGVVLNFPLPFDSAAEGLVFTLTDAGPILDFPIWTTYATFVNPTVLIQSSVPDFLALAKKLDLNPPSVTSPYYDQWLVKNLRTVQDFMNQFE